MKPGYFDLNRFREEMEQAAAQCFDESALAHRIELPGLPEFPELTDDDKKNMQAEFRHVLGMIDSMTPLERAVPEVIESTRSRRIAAGSGRSEQDVEKLILQFRRLRDMMQKCRRMMERFPFQDT